MVTHASRRRPRVFAALVAAATLSLPILLSSTASAVHDLGLFELDGNATNNTSVTGDDWSNLHAGGGTADDFTGIVSDAEADDTTYFTGGGSKDIYDIGSWAYNDLSAPDKDEITNAYAAAYHDDGDLVIYFGADRFATNGDSQIGFWFFQNEVTASGGTFDGSHQAPDADHQTGDLLVLADFTNGGAVGSAKVYEWVGAGGSDGALDLIFPTATTAVDCQNASLADDDVCATVNEAGSVTAPWSYKKKGEKGASTAQFPKGAFFEGGINVGALFQGANPCFASFLAETRSSQEPSAVLKDFVLGSFEACHPSTAMSVDSASASVTKHSGDNASLKFLETNDGNTAIESPSVSCESDSGQTVGATATPVYQAGETNNAGDIGGPPGGTLDPTLADNGVLDPGEVWQFTCEVSSLSASTTITATGHGTDPVTGDDITYCADEENPPADTICDQDEQATGSITLINPSTKLAVGVSVTYTFYETNDGDVELTRTGLTNFVTSSDCTIAETYKSGTTVNVGDTDDDGKLDVGETWTFTCTKTIPTYGSTATAFPGTADVTDVTAVGNGKDSLGQNWTYCLSGSGLGCDQHEKRKVSVSIT